MNDKRPD